MHSLPLPVVIVLPLVPPLLRKMFTNAKRQEERTGRRGTPRREYLQTLVTEFQSPTVTEQTKEQIAANLANFAYDPYNYPYLRDLNVLELFIDCLTEPNERLIEFGAGGICNACADPDNARVIVRCGGAELVVGCLSSPVRNTVRYGLGALYYLLCCDAGGEGQIGVNTEEEILRDEVVELIRKYAADVSAGGFGNLARAILDKHVDRR